MVRLNPYGAVILVSGGAHALPFSPYNLKDRPREETQ